MTHSVKLRLLLLSPCPIRPSQCGLRSLITRAGIVPQNGLKTWHLSLANEGPTVISEELLSVILIPGYFSAYFILGVSVKMN